MSKYHINKNGVPAICKATEGNCPLGGSSGNENHFDSKEDAQKAADKVNSDGYGIVSGIDSIGVEEPNEKFSKKQVARLNELFDVFEDYGFHIYRDDHVEMIENGQIQAGDGLESFELIKNGSGWTKYAEEYFKAKDYKKIAKICEEFNIDPPEYVHGD